MISKLSVVEEEADEACFWLELLVERGLVPASEVEPLHAEADQLTAIMVASRKTLLARTRKSGIEIRKSSPC